MTEQEALRRMVPPGRLSRPVWRGGILQIMVGRACDRACGHCTQGSNLAGPAPFMTVDQFRTAVASLGWYGGVVGLFGGNPALHPDFAGLCRVLQEQVPWDQRGIWTNNPVTVERARLMAATFNPAVSNVNVHQDAKAAALFRQGWPALTRILGEHGDSRHAPPFAAMHDLVPDEGERWGLIAGCDVNQNWSALVGVFRGELRGWFCELAGAQAMLHQHDPEYPDTGVPVTPGWWRAGMDRFADQVRYHCHRCGIPLRGTGVRANDPHPVQQMTATHRGIARPKRPGQRIELVTVRAELHGSVRVATDYIGNGRT